MVYLLDFIRVYDFDSLESSSYFLLKFFLKAKKLKLNIALAGGNTPLYLYSLMSKYSFDNFKFFLTDERYVPNDDEKSNYHSISKFLNVEPVYKTGDIEKDCEAFSNIVRDNPIHIALLGIGEDGHSASIFPDKNILKTCENTLISVGPNSILRISLHYNALLNSQLIFFVSKSKKAVVSGLLKEKNTIANEFISQNTCKKPVLVSDGMKDLL
ncbi:6-phosphogluconolactonase, partial [Hydrogenobaculum acidophilum]